MANGQWLSKPWKHLAKIGISLAHYRHGLYSQPANLNLPSQLPSNVFSLVSIQFAKFQQVKIFSNLHSLLPMAEFLVAL
jgi:hypothetical protein